MGMKESYKGQLDYEATITRKFIINFKDADPNYKPTEKSMTTGRLLGHVIELFDWVDTTLNYPELDWANFKFTPLEANHNMDLMAVFEEKVAKANTTLATIDEAVFNEPYTMRKGDTIMFTMPKVAVLRNFVFNHFIHHRAQLALYYRMTGVKVPSSYGPSGDV